MSAEDFPVRKQNRLERFDYSTPGAYFITICTENRRNYLCRIVGGGALDAPQTELTETGKIVQEYILSSNRMPGIKVEKYVIMPNHIHIIVFVERVVEAADPYDVTTPGAIRMQNDKNAVAASLSAATGRRVVEVADPYNAQIPRFVGALKRFCHRKTGRKLFQRSYHDHVIRGEKDYCKIWQYVDTNPVKWQEDCFYNEG